MTGGGVISCCVVVAALMLISCDRHPTSTQSQKPTSKPYLALSEADREALLEKSKRIRLGMTRSEVLEHLGAPSSDQLSTRIVPAGQVRNLRYYITEYEQHLVSITRDEYVSVTLDHDQVISIDMVLQPRHK
jgi:hypothetical protein